MMGTSPSCCAQKHVQQLSVKGFQICISGDGDAEAQWGCGSVETSSLEAGLWLCSGASDTRKCSHPGEGVEEALAGALAPGAAHRRRRVSLHLRCDERSILVTCVRLILG